MYQLCCRNFIIHLRPKMFSKSILSLTVYLFIQLETIVYILNNFSIYPEDYLTKLVKSLSRLAGGFQPAGNLIQDNHRADTLHTHTSNPVSSLVGRNHNCIV